MELRNIYCVILWVIATFEATRSESPDYWDQVARNELRRALNVRKIEKRPKNVVFFLGDGMGITTLTASRIYKGQLNGRRGEEGTLSFENFPHVGLSKTYNDDAQVPDSAGTATAFFCGKKAALGVIGLNSNAKLDVCSTAAGNEMSSILEWAQEAGKATGLVTTTRITHATPAGTYAHTPNRDWEYDGEIPAADRGRCKDIATQLIDSDPGRHIRVIFGGGRRMFLPTSAGGSRGDGLNLIDRWLREKSQLRPGKTFYVRNFTEMDQLDAANTDYVLGLFNSDHMKYELEREKTVNQSDREPSLKEMVEKAIDILVARNTGFFLAVEGGKIDHGHHAGQAKKAMHDVVAFDQAIEMAVNKLGTEDTLFVVTADHSHTLSMGGYAKRGGSILGFGGTANTLNTEPSHIHPDERVPYLTLAYANGPGGGMWFKRNYSDPGSIQPGPEDDNFIQDAGIKLGIESHGGEDVAIYANGPFAHLFHTLHEQNYIPVAIDYAACYRNQDAPHCREAETTGPTSKPEVGSTSVMSSSPTEPRTTTPTLFDPASSSTLSSNTASPAAYSSSPQVTTPSTGSSNTFSFLLISTIAFAVLIRGRPF
ncbi:hypothetical protein RvY_04453 [Ramazzottius varieornatus]|uniref:Alkaline phosphatase n=1 Tax=Ramazzottius varieornatus TaxID=947166 RepID=A0A1D1UXD5_RAMVA|nr:hypothetical protein RvY_04453 [Ramazzottius varieornatus]